MEIALIILGAYAIILVYCGMMANWEIYKMMYSDDNKKESENHERR